MTIYKDLFIDFDDTLYDTHGNAMMSLDELYSEFKLEQYFDSREQFTTAYWNINEQLWSLYAKGEITRDFLIIERFRRPLSLGQDADLSDEFCLTLGDAFLELNCQKTGVIDGAIELLEYLRSCGYRMHICSNGFSEVQHRKLEMVKMTPYFHHIILSEQAGANKPSRQFFDYALKETKALPESTLMIGDNIATDIVGGLNAGLDVVYFNPQLRELPAGVIPTMQVTSLRELLGIL